MLVWIAFLIFVFVLLALDLGVFHRKAHVISVREALIWTVVWIATALAFSAFVYFGYEHHWLGLGLEPDPVDRSAAYPDGRVNDARSALLKFLTGYIVELSLSADNVFVMAMLFSYFAIPRMYQHRVLFWGILGALAMRGAMIAIGARLVTEFAWILPLFGAVLILTAAKMAFMGLEHGDPGRNVIVRLMRRFLPVTNQFHGERFFVRAATTGDGGDADGVGAARGCSRRSCRHWSWSKRRISCSRWTRFRRSSRLRATRSWCSPATSSPSSACARSISRSPARSTSSATSSPRWRLVLLTVGVKMLAHSWFERVLGPDFNLYLLAAVLFILGTGVIVSLIEVRWNDPIGRAAKRTVRTLQAWIVPDHLVSTIAREGRRTLSRNRVAAAQRLRARRAAARRSAIGRFVPKFFRSKGTNIPLVLVHGLIEEGEKYVAFL